MDNTLSVTPEEIKIRNAIIARILEATSKNITIKLPDFDRKFSVATPEIAQMTVGLEPNDFGSTIGEFRYQFEGEEDLLHLIVTRQNLTPVSMQDAQRVAEFLLRGVPHNLAWIKPGDFTQHFYIGHDDIEKYVIKEL